jgi:hypothetical protein
VIAAVQPRNLRFHRRKDRTGRNWETFTIRTPEYAGIVKAVRAADVNSDGKTDLVFTCEHANGDMKGVLWLEYGKSPTEPDWRVHDISGGPGIIYDRIELLDLDGDGDLDVLTCEERENLGVMWYENPHKR